MANRPRKPVFYDPGQRRWVRLKRVALVLTIALLAVGAVLVSSAFTAPVLPNVDLGAARTSARRARAAVATPATPVPATGTPTVLPTVASPRLRPTAAQFFFLPTPTPNAQATQTAKAQATVVRATQAAKATQSRASQTPTATRRPVSGQTTQPAPSPAPSATIVTKLESAPTRSVAPAAAAASPAPASSPTSSTSSSTMPSSGTPSSPPAGPTAVGAEALRPAPSAQPAAGTASGAAPAPALGPARPGWVLPAAFPSALAPSASGALTPGSGETDEPTPSPAPLTVRSVGAFPGPRSHTDVIAFYVNWDDASLLSLKQHVTSLDKLIPEWLHLVGTPAGTDPAGGDAGVSLGVAGEASSDANAQRTFARDDRAKEKAVLDYLQDARPTLPVVPLINNYDPEMQDWDSEALGQMLATPLTRARTIRSLLDYVRSEDLAGIHIDFEAVPPDSQPALVDFMRELYLEFHPLGLEVSQSIPLDDDTFDASALAKWNDYVVVIAHDEHWSDGHPGPVASQRWFSDGLWLRLTEIPADKLVVAVGNYGYDWPDDGKPGADITFQEALQTAHDSDGRIALDLNSLNPTYDYFDDSGSLHHVWYLDAASTFNELADAQRYGVRGFALWRLGSEDPAVWQVFAHRDRLDKSVADAAQQLHYGDDPIYQGRGEVLKVEGTPEDGSRKLQFDPETGLITAEQMVTFPSGYLVRRWGGANDKLIALTFDDGPDPHYTPRILDILRSYGVPATFFIIGSSGDLHAELLQRMVAEGHEVGNHTFTHPDVSSITTDQLSLELNATQRLFESQLGRKSLLFRPPYGEDIEPSTPKQIKPLLLSGELGYYTIGMQVDPSDWQEPGVDDIINATIDQVASGKGNVVILHDGGGDRSQTVAALPRIIEGLRARGYQLVTVSDLMGLTRDAVMPPIQQTERSIATINGISFQIMRGGSWLISLLFIGGTLLGAARLLTITLLAIVQHGRAKGKRFPPDYRPLVGVIVPAYNEAKVIGQTIHSLLRSNYPNLDIVVMDDGSKDSTWQRAVEAAGGDPRVRVLHRPNRGKAKALDLGMQKAQAEVVVILDADTIIHPEAISRLVRHFADPKVGAVAGNAKVGNRINLLTRWQALEYVTSQNLDRRAFALLNCITVVPGAIGAWRREAILRAGRFPEDTLAEDADLTLAILELGYRIPYEDGAIAYTEAPDNVRGLLKQRFRWMLGTFQAAWKHGHAAFKPRYRALGLIAIPNVFVFNIFFPLIAPLVDFIAVLSVGLVAWNRYQHPLDSVNGSLRQLLTYYLVFVAVDYLAAITALLLERTEQWSLLIWLFFQRFGWRLLMYNVAWKAVMTAVRGRVAGWGKLERKATVKPDSGAEMTPGDGA